MCFGDLQGRHLFKWLNGDIAEVLCDAQPFCVFGFFLLWVKGISGWCWGTQGECGGEVCCGQQCACPAAAGTDPLRTL